MLRNPIEMCRTSRNSIWPFCYNSMDVLEHLGAFCTPVRNNIHRMFTFYITVTASHSLKIGLKRKYRETHLYFRLDAKYFRIILRFLQWRHFTAWCEALEIENRKVKLLEHVLHDTSVRQRDVKLFISWISLY